MVGLGSIYSKSIVWAVYVVGDFSKRIVLRLLVYLMDKTRIAALMPPSQTKKKKTFLQNSTSFSNYDLHFCCIKSAFSGEKKKKRKMKCDFVSLKCKTAFIPWRLVHFFYSPRSFSSFSCFMLLPREIFNSNGVSRRLAQFHLFCASFFLFFRHIRELLTKWIFNLLLLRAWMSWIWTFFSRAHTSFF